MMWILAAITAVSISVMSDASATSFFMDGNRLVPFMREYEKADRSDPNSDYQSAGRFMGYVMGVADVLSDTICSPNNVKFGQFGAVVVKYFNDHPNEWHMPAAEIVAKALQTTFSCRAVQ
jgi:hypothetical protein